MVCSWSLDRGIHRIHLILFFYPFLPYRGYAAVAGSSGVQFYLSNLPADYKRFEKKRSDFKRTFISLSKNIIS